MPILDKMNQNNFPDDDNRPQKRVSFADVPDDNPRKHPMPKMVPSREGRRQISVAALVERIISQFEAENTPDDSAVRAAQTRAERAKLLLPVVDYVMSVESVKVDDNVKTDIMRVAYSAIFGFGRLDQYIEDETITTLTIEGIQKISVRRGHGELEQVDFAFEDEAELKTIVKRLLKRAGADMREDMPIVEAGVRAENERFVSVSFFGPPAAYTINLDIRLHPAQAPTLETLVERETLTPESADLLRALARSEYGFTLVGQPESGKTMTLSALLTELPEPDQAVAIERTGELHLPEGMTSYTVDWPQGVGMEGITFGEQVERHAEGDYTTIVLDEVRADEPYSIAPLLSIEDAPRLIWSFRGQPDSKRLISALGMLARRADEAQGDLLVGNLFARMPFVISVRRLNGRIELREIGEWYYPDGSDLVKYRAIMQRIGGDMVMTGDVPSHPLPGVDDDFYRMES